MDRARVLQGLRTMKFEAMAERWEQGGLSQAEAAEILGMSERNFRRWYGRWLEEGESGLLDRRLGRPSPRRLPETAKAELCRLFRERYADHTVKHFHEQLVRRHNYRLGYTVTKLALHAAGLVTPAARRSAHRKKRPRRPLPGMLLFQDASTFAWLPGSDRPLDLVVTMDDATSAIYSAILVEQEGTQSSFLGLAETIAAEGLFCVLYTDRGGHYFFTAAAGKVDKTRLTQVGRALKQLGIEHIPSYSPEARGRVERVFRTLQDRLPKELRLAGLGAADAPADLAALPTASCARSTCPGTTPASRCRPSSRARPSSQRAPNSGMTCSASRRSAWSPTTTPCATTAACSRSPKARRAATSCAPRSASMTTPTARSPCSTARAASRATTATAPC